MGCGLRRFFVLACSDGPLITQITTDYAYLSFISLSLIHSYLSYIHLSYIHLSYIHLSLIHLLSLMYSSRLYPVSFPAGRIPPYGGIARPKGKHSRHKGVFCLPAADFPARIGV
jgi:hypothetical protein